MAEVAPIREALVEKLQQVDFAFTQVSPYLLSNPTPPCAYITLGEQDWPDGTRVHDEQFTFLVHVLIGLNVDVAAQAALDVLVASSGPSSIKAALEDTAGENTVTLGGLVADLQVTRCRPDRLYPIKGRPDPHATALGAEWTLLVYPNPE